MNPFGMGWRKHLPFVGMLPTILIFVIISFGPSLFTFVLSFTDISGVLGAKWHFIGLKNYVEFFTASNSRDKFNALYKTFQFCLSVTVIQNAVGVVLALILNKRFRGSNFVRTLVFLPVILGVTVSGLTWQLVLNPIDGPVEKMLHLFNTNSALLGSPHAAFSLVIFIQIWLNMGYSVIIFLAGLQSISHDLYEAGYIDGATPSQSFRYITLPLLAPTVTVNVLLSVIGSLQTYDVVYVLTGGRNETLTFGMLTYQTAFGGGQVTGSSVTNQGYASALMVILFFLVLVVTLVMQYYLRKRETQL